MITAVPPENPHRPLHDSRGIIYPDSPEYTFAINNATNGTLTELAVVEGVDIAFIIQQLISLGFNITLLGYMLSHRKLRCQKPNQIFINLLSVHILLSTAAVISKYSISEESAVVNTGFLMEMFFSLVICSFDRYINITFPYRYAMLTTFKIVEIIIGSWVISGAFVLLAIIFNITPYQTTVVCTSLILSATVILTATNIHIYLIAKRHAATIMKTTNAAAVNIVKEKKVLKATYVCFALVISFIVLWFPLLVHNGLALMKKYTPGNRKLFTKAVFNVGLFNSIIDPILYVCFRKEIKKHLRDIFYRKIDA